MPIPRRALVVVYLIPLGLCAAVLSASLFKQSVRLAWAFALGSGIALNAVGPTMFLPRGTARFFRFYTTRMTAKSGTHRNSKI